MFFRKVVFGVCVAALAAFGAITVSAQTGQVSGRVVMVDDAENETPIEGVRIDCYRTDINNSCRTVTTDKRGEFVILGIPYGARVILGVSGPNLQPTMKSEVKIGTENANGMKIIVSAGDGTVPTEEQVRELASRATTGELTEEQKKEQEELEKEIKRIEANNTKIEERNAQRSQLMKEGVAAFDEKNFDLAIEKFQAGYDLDPDFLGSAPGFLTNKAAALKQRAVVQYNEAAKTKDRALINSARDKMAADFKAAMVASFKAHDMGSNASLSDQTDVVRDNVKRAEDTIKDIFRILGQVKMTLAINLNTEDDAKEAVGIYRSAMNLIKDDPDVIAGMILALFNSGYFTNDTAQLQESMNMGSAYLAKFPQTHQQYVAITEVIDALKADGYKVKK
ncbi:MAG: carboxypeptidase-like regulatory domain-containing protein [Pyrinomonadaceae bacterium]